MIPAAFDYVAPSSVDQALAHLAENGDEAKILAGGHSLLPLMKLRLATPALLVDVGRIQGLSYVRDDGDEVAIGALTRHRELEISPVAIAGAPLLAHVAGQVGDPQVRHRGTIGGSLAHGDPASDLPAAVLALGGSVVLRGPRGERRIPAQEFFTGFLETAMAPEEMLVEIRVPRTAEGWAFQKFNLRAQDWAIVGAAVVLGPTPRVALVNMASMPVRAPATEAALSAGATPSEAASMAAEGTEPVSDLNATAEYRQHLARVLVRRAIEQAGF